MAEEFKRKPEQLTLAALVLTALAGGGGFTYNISSNKEVLSKLSEINVNFAKMESRLQATEDLKIDRRLRDVETELAVLKSKKQP